MSSPVEGSAATAALIGGRKLAKNTAWNLFGQVAPLGIGIVTIPILLQHLGVERFGLLSIAWVMIGYLSLFDLGLGKGLTKMVAELLGQGREDEIPTVTWTALMLLAILGVAGGLLLIGSAAELVTLLRVPPALRLETLQALRVIGVAIPLVTVTSGLRGVLEAKQEFRQVGLGRFALGATTFLGPVSALAIAGTLPAVIGALAVGRFLVLLMHVAFCLRSIPGLIEVGIDPRRLLPLVRFGGWITISNVLSPLLVYVDRLLIAVLVSAAAVSYYAVPYEVATKLWVIPTALVGVLFPAFAAAMPVGSDRARKLYVTGIKMLVVTLFPAILVMVALARPGLTAWLGVDFANHGTLVLQVLACAVLVNGLAVVPFSFIQAAGRPDVTAKFHLGELPLYLPMMWFMISRYGIDGAAVAWAIRASLDAGLLAWFASRMLGLQLGAKLNLVSIAGMLIAVAVAALLGAVVWQILYVATVVPLFLGLAWAKGLNGSERNFVASLWPRRPAALEPQDGVT
jgi:O-antigen/teichoic acid export membrane protein